MAFNGGHITMPNEGIWHSYSYCSAADDVEIREDERLRTTSYVAQWRDKQEGHGED